MRDRAVTPPKGSALQKIQPADAAPARSADIVRFPDAFPQQGAARQTSLSYKRSLDVVVGGLALIALSVPMALIAVLVRVTSRGPAIFVQPRAGLNGTPFTCYKFRTMYVDQQDVSGLKHTVENDPRVTPLGRVLRKLSLDELPQLFNVLMGDMSIVGPRAHAVGMLALGVPYNVLVKDYDRRHLVRPGMTGLAQVRGFRGEVCDEAHARGRIAADLEYIGKASLWLDLKLMALTIPAVMSGRAAV